MSYAATSDLLSDNLYDTYLSSTYGSAYNAPFVKNEENYVDESTGAFSLKENDLTIPGKNGFDLNFMRRFVSTSSYKGFFTYSKSDVKGKAYVVYKYDYTIDNVNHSCYVAFDNELEVMLLIHLLPETLPTI